MSKWQKLASFTDSITQTHINNEHTTIHIPVSSTPLLHGRSSPFSSHPTRSHLTSSHPCKTISNACLGLPVDTPTYSMRIFAAHGAVWIPSAIANNPLLVTAMMQWYHYYLTGTRRVPSDRLPRDDSFTTPTAIEIGVSLGQRDDPRATQPIRKIEDELPSREPQTMRTAEQKCVRGSW